MTKNRQAGEAGEDKISGEVTTLLGHGAEFSGRLSFDGAARIDGKFSGEIHAEGLLVVGPTAEIEAEIAVGSLLVQGQLTGNITATGLVELHAPGRVQGKLRCPQLLVEKGVILNASCEMPGTGDAPSPDPDPGSRTER